MFEARIFFSFHLLLLGGVIFFYEYIANASSGWNTTLGVIIVVAGFMATLTVFIEFLQDRIPIWRAVRLAFFNSVIYLSISTNINLAIGIKDNKLAVSQLADSAYFTLVTFTTLGYGDLQPTQDLRLVAAIQALLGYIFLGLAIAFVTKWIAKGNNKSNL
jgi:hypothetical protein